MEVGGERESVLEQPSERRERRAGWERMYVMRASSAAEIFFIDGKKCRRRCFFFLFWVHTCATRIIIFLFLFLGAGFPHHSCRRVVRVLFFPLMSCTRVLTSAP